MSQNLRRAQTQTQDNPSKPRTLALGAHSSDRDRLRGMSLSISSAVGIFISARSEPGARPLKARGTADTTPSYFPLCSLLVGAFPSPTGKAAYNVVERESTTNEAANQTHAPVSVFLSHRQRIEGVVCDAAKTIGGPA